MIKKAAERITKFICKGSEISADMQEVYQYGIELTLSTILNILCIVPASVVFPANINHLHTICESKMINSKTFCGMNIQWGSCLCGYSIILKKLLLN